MPTQPDALLALALSRPREALARARELLATSSDPVTLSYARQAAGIVLRDSGEWTQAVDQLRAGVRTAASARRPDREADVRATLGAALVGSGRTRQGLHQLDLAAHGSNGVLLARVLMRRAFVLSSLGRHEEALADLRRCLSAFRAAGDVLWEARTLSNRAFVHLARASLRRAEEDTDRAERLMLRTGQQLEAVGVLHNRGLIAYCRGDLPRTLRLYDESARRYDELGVVLPDLAYDRCQAFLAAGLTREAVEVVDAALDASALQPARQAELRFVAAAAALADGDPERALSSARRALSQLRRQEREWWATRADVLVLRARFARGDRGPVLASRAADLGDRLASMRSDDAPVALLLAGRLAADGGGADASSLFRAAGRYRRHASPLVKATAWLATALDRDLTGDVRGVLRACGSGLDALDDHRAALGSSELRALASAHGADLSRLALRRASTGRPRSLLAWTERWRATSLAEPPVRPPRRSTAAHDVALVRSRARLLDAALQEGQDAGSVARERAALEAAIRARRHHLAGTGRSREGFDVDGFVDQVDGTTFVELVEVDGVLHALPVHRGRVHHRVVGPVAAATQAVAAARFALRQAARGRPTTLAGVGERLQHALLGDVRLGPGPVVVAPPSRLHAAPWSLLPALADRPVSVVPSATMWLRARAARASRADEVVLVAGPGLRTGGSEVDVLARREQRATLLRDGTATVDATLAALDGVGLAHVAAHGRFRPDSPMFSSLLLDDGPLTVHDLELLDRPPHRLVLSACDSGVMVPVGADELLGLTGALLSLGTAGVVSSVAEVNDEATVDLMLDLHGALASGAGVAEAMHEARTRARGDLVREATAAAFVALGV